MSSYTLIIYMTLSITIKKCDFPKFPSGSVLVFHQYVLIEMINDLTILKICISLPLERIYEG